MFFDNYGGQGTGLVRAVVKSTLVVSAFLIVWIVVTSVLFFDFMFQPDKPESPKRCNNIVLSGAEAAVDSRTGCAYYSAW